MAEPTSRETMLTRLVKFTKENYAPFSSLAEQDVAGWLMKSYLDNTLVPVIIGDSLMALYEYWLVTPDYLDVLQRSSGYNFPVPTAAQRKGDILYCPMIVLRKDMLGKGFQLTRLVTEYFKTKFPGAKGMYRWELKQGQLGFISFGKEH